MPFLKKAGIRLRPFDRLRGMAGEVTPPLQRNVHVSLRFC